MKFEANPYGSNLILEGDGFYISYNAAPCAGISFFKSDKGSAETALCVNDEFKILNGDFRKDYEKLAPQGIEACLGFYNKMKDRYDSSWSTPKPITGPR